MSDIGTALTQSIANDGQTTPVANLPMATFRHTNVGNAVNRNEYAAAGQVQDSTLQYLTSVAGVDTITASITPSPTAYVAGQTFRFVAAGANTTAAVTLNINGLGAKNVTKLGIGSLQSGMVVEVIYDGTQFQPISAPSGALINIQRITATGTYTPTPGTTSVIVEIVGGGGASGGAPATGAGAQSVGVAGGAGAYAKSRLITGFSGVTVTIGAGGTGNSGAAGGNGVASSFGALITAPGGFGGGTLGPSGVMASQQGGIGAAIATGGNILNMGGQPAGDGLVNPIIVSPGGNTPLGQSVAYTFQTTGNPGTGFGSGAGGTSNGASQAARTGGAGAPGICIIYEYA